MVLFKKVRNTHVLLFSFLLLRTVFSAFVNLNLVLGSSVSDATKLSLSKYFLHNHAMDDAFIKKPRFQLGPFEE